MHHHHHHHHLCCQNYIVAHFLPRCFRRVVECTAQAELYWHTALVAASWLVIDALPRFTKLVPRRWRRW